MTDRRGLYAALRSTGLPVALNAWRPGAAPELPYVVYRAVDFARLGADNRTAWHATTYDVELYTPIYERDFEAEAAIQAALDGAGAAWSKSFPGDIEEERMTETVWTVAVVGD